MRWYLLITPRWTPEDAARLKAIVALHGTGDWNAVSAEMGNRTAEQARLCCWSRPPCVDTTDSGPSMRGSEKHVHQPGIAHV